jgi:integrase
MPRKTVRYAYEGKTRKEKTGTRSAAIALYRARKDAIRRDEKLPDSRNSKRVKLSDLIDAIIVYTEHHKDHRNYVSRGEIVRAALGSRPADEIKPEEIEKWLRKQCRTNSTANRYRAFISLCYREGIRNGKVRSNPARLVRQRPENNGRIRYLSHSEFDRLHDAVAKRFPGHLAEFVVSVHTGMRLGEQYRVTWADVDWDRRLLRIESKNGTVRTVVLNSAALAVLEPLRAAVNAKEQRIFPRQTRADKKTMNEDFNTRSWFEPCLRDAGIAGYTWHCNRHTFCSWIAMSVGSIKDIQQLAGHKTIQMSARYAHLSDAHIAAAAERLVRG